MNRPLFDVILAQEGIRDKRAQEALWKDQDPAKLEKLTGPALRLAVRRTFAKLRRLN
jgi:hypothetical protein